MSVIHLFQFVAASTCLPSTDGKLEWHHVIHVFHFIGIAFVLSQPVTTLLIWATGPGRDVRVSAKFAELLSRIDRVALIGVGILIVSGIGQIWAHGIGPGDIFTQQVWLAVKLILVALLVLNGVILAGPAIRSRVRLLHEVADSGGTTPAQEAALRQSYLRTQWTGSIMILLLLGILFMVIFQPFTTNPC